MKKKKRKGKATAIMACLFMVVFVYSAYRVFIQGSEYVRDGAAYSKLTEFVTKPEATVIEGTGVECVETAEPTVTSTEREYDYPDIVWPEVDFERLREINPEIVGWIYLEGSEINYPVVQAGDNSKYLDYLFDGTKSKTGCPFLDASNAGDFSDEHSIIYAHNRKDGSMFGRLSRFKNQEYYEEHPHFLLITEDARYVLEIFSGHITRSDGDTWQKDFQDEAEFTAWVEALRERSSIKTRVSPTAGERVITLSTCSYEFDDARYVVHGVLRKAREG